METTEIISAKPLQQDDDVVSPGITPNETKGEKVVFEHPDETSESKAASSDSSAGNVLNVDSIVDGCSDKPDHDEPSTSAESLKDEGKNNGVVNSEMFPESPEIVPVEVEPAQNCMVKVDSNQLNVVNDESHIHVNIESAVEVSEYPLSIVNNDHSSGFRTGNQESESDSDSTTSTSSLSSVAELSEDGAAEDEVENYPKDQSCEGPRVKGELRLCDLPQIEDLKISISDHVKLTEIGQVQSVVGCLVVIKGCKGIPPLDEGSILFRAGRRPFGKIFETFGPVPSPFYSVRFNSPSDTSELNLQPQEAIYYAPEETSSLTQYVFMSQVQQQKGSDASWTDNVEPPEKCLDYSDDEQERAALAKLRAKSKRLDNKGEQVGEESSQKKSKRTSEKKVKNCLGRGRGQHNTEMNRQSFIQPGASTGIWQTQPHQHRVPIYPNMPQQMMPGGMHNTMPAASMYAPYWNQPVHYGSMMSSTDSQFYRQEDNTPKPSGTFTDTRFIQSKDQT